MTNFQFYLNSPLQGRSILGPADGFFLKPSPGYYLLFIGLQLHRVWVFQGLQVVVLPSGAGSIPAQAGSGGFALSPGLIFPVLTKAKGWNNNFHHPK